MRTCIIALSLLLGTAAFAQQPPPPYVAFTVDEGTYKQLQDYLGNQPAKFSVPLLNWLNSAESRAVSDKAIADKAAADKAAAEAKKDTPAAPAASPPQ
jgi:hypothetical protein